MAQNLIHPFRLDPFRFAIFCIGWACSVCVGGLAFLFGWDRVREAARYKAREH